MLSLLKGAATVSRDLRSLRRWTVPVFIFWIAALMLIVPEAMSQPDWLKEAVSKSEGYQVDKDASALVLHKVAQVDVR